MILKAQQGDTLSSGKLTLYAFDDHDTPVGCVELYNYDPINRRAAVGIVVSNEYRHKGHGTAMVQTLIYADIAANNAPSLHIFQHAGYQHCATLRDWVIRSDRYIDTLRYQLILN